MDNLTLLPPQPQGVRSDLPEPQPSWLYAVACTQDPRQDRAVYGDEELGLAQSLQVASRLCCEHMGLSEQVVTWQQHRAGERIAFYLGTVAGAHFSLFPQPGAAS